jgi:hypothetical protein
VLQGGAAGDGDELSVSEVTEASELCRFIRKRCCDRLADPSFVSLVVCVLQVMGGAEEEACEEGKNDDVCMQRRLLRDAHLDYIYTQHRGRP